MTANALGPVPPADLDGTRVLILCYTVLTIIKLCTVPSRSPSSSGSNVKSLKLLLKRFVAAVPPAVLLAYVEVGA
jgi:hypothetical protein